MVEENSNFDPLNYWRDRHQKYRTSELSIENLSKKEEEAIAASEVYKEVFARFLASPHLAAIATRPDRAAVDLGCGIGRLSGVVNDAGYRYLGVEVSPEAVERARAGNPTAEFEVGDFTRFKRAEAFDIAIVSYVLCHVVDDEILDLCIDNISSSLRPGGLVVQIDRMADESKRIAPHVITRSLQDYLARYERSGLTLTPALEDLQREFSRDFHIFAKHG